ncbi:hypothetical protein U0070_016971, partial [Myodes glareolus]
GNTRRKNRHAEKGHSHVQLTFFKVCVQCVTKDKDIRKHWKGCHEYVRAIFKASVFDPYGLPEFHVKAHYYVNYATHRQESTV